MGSSNNPFGESQQTGPSGPPRQDPSLVGPSGEASSPQGGVRVPAIVIHLLCLAVGSFCFLYLVFSESGAATILSFFRPLFLFLVVLIGHSPSNSLLQNSNSPAFEASLSFHDLVLGALFPILLGVLLFLLFLFFSPFRHRAFTESQPVEFFWTFAPTLLLFFLVFPSLSLLYLLDEVGFPSSTTKVSGHQWY